MRILPKASPVLLNPSCCLFFHSHNGVISKLENHTPRFLYTCRSIVTEPELIPYGSPGFTSSPLRLNFPRRNEDNIVITAARQVRTAACMVQAVWYSW